MKALKYAIAGLLIVGGGMFVLSACGPTESCSSDTDCNGDEVCSATGSCLVNCDDSASACTDTQFCREAPSGKKGCHSTPADDGMSDTGTGDDDGGGMEDGGGDDGAQNYFVQVKDVTADNNTMDRDGDGTADGQQMCDAGESTEGSDVFGIELIDDSGQSLAWGEITVGNVQTTMNKTDSVFDGTAPSLVDSPDPDNGQQCPGSGGSTEFGDSTVVSLGCGGSVVVGFKDDNDEFIPIKSGYEVVAYEYGTSCFTHENGELQCKPEQDPVDCAIEYVSANLCDATESPMAQQGDLQSAQLPSAGGDFPQCSENNLGSAKGIVGRFPVN